MSVSTGGGGFQVKGVALSAPATATIVALSFADAERMNLETMTLVPFESSPADRIRSTPTPTAEVVILLDGRIEHRRDGHGGPGTGRRRGVPGCMSHCAMVLGEAEADMIVAYTSGRREYEAVV